VRGRRAVPRVRPRVDGHRPGDRRERRRGLLLTHAEAEAALDAAASRLGEELGVDGPALLHERETLLGLAPQGTISAGGTCRLLATADRWMALNLARADDIDAMPAWVGRELDEPVWDAVGDHARTITAAEGVALAQLLGVPAAVAIAPEEFEGPSVTVDAHDAPVGSPRDPVPNRL
jgi:hypothetical protein